SGGVVSALRVVRSGLATQRTSLATPASASSMAAQSANAGAGSTRVGRTRVNTTNARIADPASQPNAEAKPLLDRAVLKDPGLSTSDVDQGFQAGGARAAQKRENECRLDPLGEQQGPFGRTQSFLGRCAPGPRSAAEKDGATDADPGGDSNAKSVTVPSALG